MPIDAIVLDPKDNVGVALRRLEKGTQLSLAVGETAYSVRLTEPISYQHKFALCTLSRGGNVIKYGECIGVAPQDIEAGEHVHVQNMTGLRAK